jgi:hypothetical protein
MSTRISVLPVHEENQNAQKMLQHAKVNSKEAIFKIEDFDDCIRIKNICADITFGSNGTTKHIPISLTHDFLPDQIFTVNKTTFKVAKT